jgi:cytoskeletal protein RodZ
VVVDEKSQASGARTGGDATLGKLLTASRQQGGFTPEQVAAGTHIPAQYIKALESDDYGLISDQLYMLPFLRRYAAFVGLDPEDVASRFVRDVQRAETGAAKVGEPIEMMTSDRRRKKTSGGAGRYLLALLAIVIIAAVTTFVIEQREDLIRRFLHRAQPAASQASQPQASAQPADSSSDMLKSSVAPADAGDRTGQEPQN